jgi:hypothetical protein
MRNVELQLARVLLIGYFRLSAWLIFKAQFSSWNSKVIAEQKA